MAVEHKDITDPEVHEPKGISTALAGQIYISDGAGSGVWTSLETGVSNVTQVGDASDLPAAVGGVITLAPSTIYLFNDIVDIGSDRIEVSEDSVMIGIHRELCGITSSTTSVLISGNGADLRIQAMTLNAPTATKLIQFDGASATKTLSVRDVKSVTHTGIGVECTSAGAFVMDYCVFFGGTDVVKCFGVNGNLVFDTVSITGYTGCGIFLDSAVFNFEPTIRGCSLIGTGGADTSICGAANNANLGSTDLLARVQSNVLGSTTPLDGITQGDTQWLFQDNSGVYDTTVISHTYTKGNTATTTISASNTPVKINTDVAWTTNFDQHFTNTTDGRATYDGFQEKVFELSATITGTCASSTQDFTLYFAKNGTVLPEASATREFTASVISSTTIIGTVAMLPTDYIEVWVENDANTNNFNVKDISFIVKEA